MRWDTISPDGKTVCLRKFDGDFSFLKVPKDTDAASVKGLAIDTETTGFMHEQDEIIEIACREFAFNPKTGAIEDVLKYYESRQEPSQPLKREVEIITGLAMDDLKGQSIDWKVVNHMIGDASLVMAHNAGFDRPFVDAKSTASRDTIWGCTCQQIGWLEKHGNPSSKLENLSYYHGFFTDAHRALNDVNALLFLLTKDNNYLKELLEDTRIPRVKVQAFDSPFKTKDILKERGYKWDPVRKTWWTTIQEAAIRDEVEFLETKIYHNRFPGKINKIKPSDRFKAE